MRGSVSKNNILEKIPCSCTNFVRRGQQHQDSFGSDLVSNRRLSKLKLMDTRCKMLKSSQVAKVVITWQTSPVDRLILQILLPAKITMRSSVTALFAKPLQMKQKESLRLLRLVNLWHDMHCSKL